MKKLLILVIFSMAQVIMAQEYYLYNTYYDCVLGTNEAGDGPALSKYGTKKDGYVFVAEPSTLHEGYVWLRQKSSGKYLQASNKTGDTWSVWLAGSLNKSYNSYEWKLSQGIEGNIISNRGEAINTAGNYWLAPDAGKESQTYIGVYYDKPQSERSVWQILDASKPYDEARVAIYVDALNEAIRQGEAIYDNPMFGTHEEQYELAVALYNARSAVETASLENIKTMEDARKALLAAIANAQEGKYTIWISGKSFAMQEKFTLSLRNVTLKDGTSAMFIIRNSVQTGVTYTIRENGSYWFSFDGENVKIYHDGTLAETLEQAAVPATTSAGTSAEWTVFGADNMISYAPEIISNNSALECGKYEQNQHGKTEVTALMVKGTKIDIDFSVDYHVLSTQNDADAVTLSHEDAWLIFDNIRPSDVKGYSGYRKAIYLHGCVVYKPYDTAFYGYSGQLYDGDEYKLKKGKNINGTWANEIQSFILKRGYMVCLATEADGGGYSRVYVADHEDKEIEALPELLNHRISYINIRPWNWVSKKGWATTEGIGPTNTEGKLVGATWFYSWSADKSTQTDMEYVPHKAHIYWPGWDAINQTNSTCVLGYNEPEHSEQHSDDCGTTIDAWTATTHTPEFRESGLRIGSPSPTDAGWLKEYIGHCNDMAYRCDFVSFHAYWGTNEAPNADSWKSQLQSIYNNTKRPIWLTEWNNGASWTSESWPSSTSDKYARQKNAIINILKVLDECDFIERYAIYNWDSWFRAVMSWDNDKNNWWITPCGEVYRDDHPTHAYQEKMQFVPIGWFPKMKTDNQFSFTLKLAGAKLNTVITDKNGDYTETEELEYQDQESKEWKHFYTITGRQKFETNSERKESYNCTDCVIDAFMADNLTLRLKITTLKGETTYTDAVTQAVPPALRLFVGIDSVAETNAESNKCYNVSGQSVKEDYKGIVISSGKKTLRK